MASNDDFGSTLPYESRLTSCSGGYGLRQQGSVSIGSHFLDDNRNLFAHLVDDAPFTEGYGRLPAASTTVAFEPCCSTSARARPNGRPKLSTPQTP